MRFKEKIPVRPWYLLQNKTRRFISQSHVPFSLFPFTDFQKALSTLAFSMDSPPTPPSALTAALLPRLLSFKSLLIWSVSYICQLSLLLKSCSSWRVLPGTPAVHYLPASSAPKESPSHGPSLREVDVPTIHPVNEAKHYGGCFDASSTASNNQRHSIIFPFLHLNRDSLAHAKRALCGLLQGPFGGFFLSLYLLSSNQSTQKTN